jgi:2-keto-3-deoxy-L-rhamnonate aldolase RhmA
VLDLGKRVRGVFVKVPTTEVVDLVMGTGYDFAVVDLEHSQLGETDAFRLIRHGAVQGFPVLARIPSAERGLVNRLLEAGAAGLHLSTVRRVEEVRALRRACRYAPHGTRSIGLAHPGGRYGGMSMREYLDAQGGGPLVIPQIETHDTDDPLEEIAREADVLFIGPADLSVDVELDEGRVAARIDEIAGVAERIGVALGSFGLDDPRVRYTAVSTDLGLLRKALLDAAAKDAEHGEVAAHG